MTSSFSASESITVAREGGFELDMAPDKALPLFTAPGERLWISHWDPTILSGDGFEAGTVFVTSGHGHTSYWYVTVYDTESRRAQYVRVTPGADTGTVDVSVEANEAGGSYVRVGYRLTSLSEAGSTNLENTFDQESYDQMMQEWKRMIEESRERIEVHWLP